MPITSIVAFETEASPGSRKRRYWEIIKRRSSSNNGQYSLKLAVREIHDREIVDPGITRYYGAAHVYQSDTYHKDEKLALPFSHELGMYLPGDGKYRKGGYLAVTSLKWVVPGAS